MLSQRQASMRSSTTASGGTTKNSAPAPQRLANWRVRVGAATTTTTKPTATPSPRPPAPLLEVLGPPPGYAFRADVMPETRRIVQQTAPELLDLVERGVLVAWRRGAGASPAAAAALRGEVAPSADALPEPEVVLVLGVAHSSSRSAGDVERVVRAARPENVVVELCRTRISLLGGVGGGGGGVGGGEGGEREGQAAAPRNPVPLGGAPSFAGAMARSLRLGGQAGLVLQLALGWSAKRALKAEAAEAAAAAAASAASSASTTPTTTPIDVGAEFRAAARAADAVGAQLVLGDRPIEVTLGRAWAACGGLGSKASLLRDLLLPASAAAGGGAAAAAAGDGAAAAPTPTPTGRWRPYPGESLADAAERLRADDDAVEAALQHLVMRHPKLASPLVHERDAYLAWSLRRSKAVRGSRVAVGVVGAAHLRGVAWCLRHGARYTRADPSSGSGGAAAADESMAPLSFSDLARGPGVGAGGKGGGKGAEAAVKRAVMDVSIGVAAYAIWEALF
jgi:hypothetical protein